MNKYQARKAQQAQAKQATSNANKNHYCFLMAEMRAGGVELRRFHVTEDPQHLTGTAAVEFMARVCIAMGISPADIKDNGDRPSLATFVFDTEAECKAKYDEAVKFVNATRVC